MATTRYLWKSLVFSMYLCCVSSSQIPNIAVPGHISDVMSVLLFTQQPYLSCLAKLLTVRLKKPMLELNSLLICLFWTFRLIYKQNLSALQTPFQWQTWSPSPQLDLWQWTSSSYVPELLLARILSYTEFDKLTYRQFMTLRRYACHFV